MKFSLTLTAALALTTLASAAAAECGRWTSCPEDPVISAKTAAKLYIYGNTGDVEPWLPEVEKETQAKDTAKTVVKSSTMGSSAEAKDDLAAASSIENEYEMEDVPSDADYGSLPVEEQKALIDDTIAELTPAQKQYVASALAKDKWDSGSSESAYVVQDQ